MGAWNTGLKKGSTHVNPSNASAMRAGRIDPLASATIMFASSYKATLPLREQGTEATTR